MKSLLILHVNQSAHLKISRHHDNYKIHNISRRVYPDRPNECRPREEYYRIWCLTCEAGQIIEYLASSRGVRPARRQPPKYILKWN